MPAPKNYQKMTLDELRAETAQYDAEMLDVEAHTAPLSASERAAHDRIMAAPKRPPGRPVVGRGAKMVAVSIEQGLLAAADDYADARGMSRSELIAVGLRMAIAARRATPGGQPEKHAKRPARKSPPRGKRRK